MGENHKWWISDRSLLKNENRSLRYSTLMKEWRLDIFKLDNYQCVPCNDRSRKGHAVKLNAHHIKRFCDFAALRFERSNGATLCIDCHSKVTGHETEYEKELRDLINKRREEMIAGG